MTCFALISTVALLAAPNALPNPSFEEISRGKVVGWKPAVWAGKAQFIHAEEGHTGSRSLLISAKKGSDTAWSAEVPVKPHTRYRLSGWVKTENVKPSTGHGALFNLHRLPVKTGGITGTTDWTKLETYFVTGDEDSVQFNCLLGGWGAVTGKAWFDDVVLERVDGSINPAVTIDAAKTGKPISKYIYGQFIEHLGHCIHGGIWAEMLEDRKFFYGVNDKESPWEASDGVVMDKQHCYTGEHSVVLEQGQSISQAGIGLTKGRKYDMAVVLSGSATLEIGGSAHSVDGASGFERVSCSFTAHDDTEDGKLIIKAVGGLVFVGCVSLMPADNVRGMRRDTLALLKDLNAPVYRWPGGNFVSGYDWKDGIGPRDKRPPRKNPAWTGVEANDFGLDEFMDFCRELNTEPYIAVNSGAGNVESAVEELQYANGAADTPMGKWRGQNGHAAPYGVKWWGIGNEMYGGWQIGHMPLEEYVKKHNQFADAMRAEDSAITLIGVGATGKWSETMLAECADHMDLLSEHFYCREEVGSVASHVWQIVRNVRHKADSHREYHKRLPALKGKNIPIALDEWNYWYGDSYYGELGTRYFLKDALGIAAGIHEMTRNSDVFLMANYAQTVNVIGCIKTTDTAAGFATTGLALKLYRREFGSLPIDVSHGAEPLDVAAAWTKDFKAITVGVVNPLDSSVPLRLNLQQGVTLTGNGRVWVIAGSEPKAFNTPGQPQNVVIEEETLSGVTGELKIPAYSVNLYRLEVKQP